jgi:hypothetical protein
MNSSKKNQKETNKENLEKSKFTKEDLKNILGGNVEKCATSAKMDNATQPGSDDAQVSDNLS